MKRVAALCLPMWPVERLRRAERTAAPPEPREPPAGLPGPPVPFPPAAGGRRAARHEGHWRPGARWAGDDSPSAAGHGAGGAPSGESSARAPLLLSERSGNRVLIHAACPRALALGLVPGMAITQARAQVPGLDIRPADPAGDRAALARLAAALARRWSPVVALAGEATLLLDLTGVAHLFGGEAAMARRLVRLLARLGFSARIAVADTAGAAWALAHHGADAVALCPPGAHADTLAALPPEALRIGEDAAELLRRFGIVRTGTLMAMPRAPLVRRFGARLALRLDQALGHAPEPLDPVVPPRFIAVGRRFAEPLATADAIGHWLGRLAAELGEALAGAGRGARMVALVADRVDGVPQRIAIGLARASRDPLHIARLLARRIEAIDPGYGIDALTLHVRRSEPLDPQPVGEAIDGAQPPDLAPLVDTLATRVGMAGLWRAAPVESDVPERSVTRASPLDPPGQPQPPMKPDDVRRLDRAGPLPPWHARWPRPARLLTRPERLDHVLAELPDQPPRRFTWRGVAHRVVRADGPERVHGEWWKRLSEVHGSRDYFRVEDEAGRRYWLFRRGDGERAETGDLSWYLHGVFG
ncbi:Y-family DNA polymerase [Sphingomonas canadensis]|uniref:DNA-directed DNA polymerase n=1 Tax=Sphingomonas canadensis TaxID=1219257 RepID=A0ABW3H0W7_9SPHN|nr:DNA polymerase Y family protein [Sphingomonas canadensis]MCW3834984.1 DNA polymerase Y family protein [Sphingomonas canadensis]